jgi:hypothetical protein
LTPFELQKMAGFDGSIIPVFSLLRSATNMLTFTPTKRDLRKITPGMSTIEGVADISTIFNDN